MEKLDSPKLSDCLLYTSRLRFVIKDNGKGIGETTLARLNRKDSRGDIGTDLSLIHIFIGGKRTGTFLLFLTAWASFSGAGNFIGQAGRGALEGISAYWLWLGEGLMGGIIMGYILAPYLARFKYLSMPHFVSGYLFGGDHYIRRVGGLAALMPNVV